MSWVATAIIAAGVALALAYFFPDLAESIYGVIAAAQGIILTIVAVLVIFYFLSTGVGFLVLVGAVLLIVLVWGFLFDDSVGFLEV